MAEDDDDTINTTAEPVQVEQGTTDSEAGQTPATATGSQKSGSPSFLQLYFLSYDSSSTSLPLLTNSSINFSTVFSFANFNDTPFVHKPDRYNPAHRRFTQIRNDLSRCPENFTFCHCISNFYGVQKRCDNFVFNAHNKICFYNLYFQTNKPMLQSRCHLPPTSPNPKHYFYL